MIYKDPPNALFVEERSILAAGLQSCDYCSAVFSNLRVELTNIGAPIESSSMFSTCSAFSLGVSDWFWLFCGMTRQFS
jgi:hypothetical protein